MVSELQKLLEAAGVKPTSSDEISKTEYVLQTHSGILDKADLWAIEEYLKFLQKGDGYIRPVGGIAADVIDRDTVVKAKTIVKYLSRV